jgi:hypothetical protein
MAETFKRAGGAISSSNTTVYTCPSTAGDTAVVLSISLANKTTSIITATVEILDSTGSVASCLIYQANIAAYTGLEIVQNKVILEAGEAIRIGTNSNNNLSATCGILEITG